MKATLEQELKDIGSVLSNLPQQPYLGDRSQASELLDGMEDRFVAYMRSQQEAPKAASLSMWERYQLSSKLAVAASIAIMCFGIFGLWRNTSSMNFSQNEVEAYLVNEGEIISDSSDHISEPIKSENMLRELSTDEIRQYILENEDVDIKTI